MNDRGLVEALRARDANALAELYDKYAESVYAYCWILTGGPDGAQVALRDTMIAAEARIHALADPARFRVWLYALARGECLRRRPVASVGTDTEPGYTGLGAVARDAVDRLPTADREILELVHRHGFTLPDAARVLGLSRRHARSRYGSAAGRLFDAVTAELRGRESQVFGLLPQTVLPESLRVRVMSCFVDPDLLPYRRLVARRVGPLDGSGFPVAADRRIARGLLAGAASVAMTLAVAVLFTQFAATGGNGGGVATRGTSPPPRPPADTRALADGPRDSSPAPTRPFARMPVVGIGLPTPARPMAAYPYARPPVPPPSSRTTPPARTPAPSADDVHSTGVRTPGPQAGSPASRPGPPAATPDDTALADRHGEARPTVRPRAHHPSRDRSEGDPRDWNRDPRHGGHGRHDHSRRHGHHPGNNGHGRGGQGGDDGGGHGDGGHGRGGGPPGNAPREWHSGQHDPDRPNPGPHPSPRERDRATPGHIDRPAASTPTPSHWLPPTSPDPWHRPPSAPQNVHFVPVRHPNNSPNPYTHRTTPAPAPAPGPCAAGTPSRPQGCSSGR